MAGSPINNSRIPSETCLALSTILMNSSESSRKSLESCGNLCLSLLGKFQYDNRYSVVVSVKVVLYISSFFTSMLNNMLSVNASKTLFSLHSKIFS
jgi:hypothetical protein